jgi:hypothetical protein
MTFVVRVSDPTNEMGWLAAVDRHGRRAFVSRELAEVFPDANAAHAAIAQVPPILRDIGVIFAVESVE